MNENDLTLEEQRKKIADFYAEQRRMPTYAEIAKLAGFSSKNAAYKLVDRLIEIGALGRDPQGFLTPRRLFGTVKRLGVVEAGFPTGAEEDASDAMTLDEYLIENRQATYLLEVKGDSMIDAGIHEGDLVIAERGRSPRPGEIVIAEVDGGWTMKYYRKKGTQVWLEAANKAYKPIYPKEELKVAAVVKGVVRKY